MSDNQSDSAELYELVKNKKWSEILPSVRKNPAESSVWVFDEEYGHGRLALHLACSLNAPRGIIAVLHNSNPKAVSTPEKDGRYPLHVACEKGAGIRVVQLLINIYPDALFAKDDSGLLPFHYALSRIENFEIIKLLLRAASNFAAVDKKADSSELSYDDKPLLDSSHSKFIPYSRSHSTSAIHDYQIFKHETGDCDTTDNVFVAEHRRGDFKLHSKSQSVRYFKYDDGTMNVDLSSLVR